ncbi:interferon alpha-2-like [Salminus brasiliensis]|uniref:interferon alpha-2-like n=1 Tax=Salminus brasiliensis TaxID=930266 RepID=UPI003B833F1C
MDALKVLSIVVLLVLQALDAAVIPCAWTQFRLRVMNEESIELLKNMGDVMPLKCLEKGGRAFPDDTFIKVQDEDLVVVALETLRGVERIFKNEPTSVTWDREKLGLFRNVISYRQVENLQKCVEGHTSQNAMGSSSANGLKSYFEKLEEELKSKELSECSWEMVRDEVQHVLIKFQTFLQSRK